MKLALLVFPCYQNFETSLFFSLRLSPRQDSNNESLEKLIKQYSQMFDLSAPMRGCVLNQGRYLFLEGDLKFKDNIGKVKRLPYTKENMIHSEE
jgi:hypothetical protein